MLNCRDDFLALHAHLPDDLMVLALDLCARLSLYDRCNALRTLAPHLPAGLRAELIGQLGAEMQGSSETERRAHVRSLMALAVGLPDEEHLVAGGLEYVIGRRWWEFTTEIFLDIIVNPRLSGTTHDAAVAAAVRQCFDACVEGRADRLVDVLGSEELTWVLGELPRIRDRPARADTLAALMRRGGAVGEPATLVADGHVLDHAPPGCTQSELFAIVAASAWWIRRQGGSSAVQFVVNAVLDLVQRWR